MSPPGTPALGNGTLTLPLNPDRFPQSHPPAAIVRARHGVPLRIVRARHGVPLRGDNEGTCVHPGGPTAHDNYREVNSALSTVRPSEPSDCARVAIRPEPRVYAVNLTAPVQLPGGM